MYILLRRNVVLDTFQIDICIFVKTFGNRMHSGARFFIGCRESHIFPYANFWREIAFSMCSVQCEAFWPIDFTFDMIIKIKKL